MNCPQGNREMTERYAYDYEERFFVDMSIVDENGLGEEMLSSEVVDRLNTLQAERDALVQNLKPVIEYVFDGLGETFLPEEHMDRTREDYIVECTIELDSFVSKATRKELQDDTKRTT